MKLSTLNVIELVNEIINVIHAFPDTKDGCDEAETLFIRIATEQEIFTAEEIEIGLEDGLLEKGLHKLFLVHSDFND